MEIERIDYSQPGYKEMFANYGLTAIAALSLEKVIWLLVTALESLGKNGVDIQQTQQPLGMRKRSPMGPLIEALHSKIELGPELTKNLADALGKRNFIVHHFFADRVDNLRSSPAELSNELSSIRDFFIEVYSRIDELLGEAVGELNKPLDEIDPQFKKRLKHSSNKGIQPIAEKAGSG